MTQQIKSVSLACALVALCALSILLVVSLPLGISLAVQQVWSMVHR